MGFAMFFSCAPLNVGADQLSKTLPKVAHLVLTAKKKTPCVKDGPAVIHGLPVKGQHLRYPVRTVDAKLLLPEVLEHPARNGHCLKTQEGRDEGIDLSPDR
jgi:hypothetical protein